LLVKRQRIQLPRTGQTTSYVDGDDGYFQAGNPRATRFVDNGNGTISDRATGLQWVKQPELIIPGAVGIDATNLIQSAEGNWADATAYVLADLVEDTTDSKFYVCVVAHTSDDASGTDTDAPNTGSAYWRETVWNADASTIAPAVPAMMTYANALTNCESLSYAGFTDWRLPNINELLSILDWSLNPAINPLFTNVAAVGNNRYWSSTPRAAAPTTYNWAIRFNGDVYIQVLAVGTETVVRPVRGGRING